jgi:acetyl esterase/lipase
MHDMALWPDEYESLRDEARAMAEMAAEGFAAMMAGLSPDERMTKGRELMIVQDAPEGRDEVIAGVPCRVFDPNGDARRGTYMHLHGGGMMWGSPRMNDTDNANLSSRLGVRVVSVDYRLAPEHPFPAGSDDCLAVAKWLLENEPGTIAIGGESAGAYFAVLTLLRLREEFGNVDRIAGANLVFGVFDLSGTPSNRGVRPTDLGDILDPEFRDLVRSAYLPGSSIEDARDPSVSPLFADLGGLPPALFTVGFADHLLDDSLFMHARWSAFGNRADLMVYPDCTHGFTYTPTELARRAHERINDFLEAMFTTQQDRQVTSP